MNPLGNGGGLPPQLLNNIQRVKGLMQMANGNPMALLQNNPQMRQVMQMLQTQNPEQVFRNMANQMGVNPNDILSQLRN